MRRVSSVELEPTPEMTFPEVVWNGRRVSFASGSEPISGDTGLPATRPYAVLVFVLWNAAYLLTNIPGRGWSIPGGRMESGETPPETGRREVLEETGAIVRTLEPVDVYTLHEDDVAEKRIVPVYYSVAESVGPLPACSESLGVKSVAFANLAEVYYMWDPLIEAVFKFVDSRVRTV